MGQDLIFLWLNEQALRRKSAYFSCRQMARALSEYGLPCHINRIYQAVNKLYAWGYLDLRMQGSGIIDRYQRRSFRLKRKYVNPSLVFEAEVRAYHEESYKEKSGVENFNILSIDDK